MNLTLLNKLICKNETNVRFVEVNVCSNMFRLFYWFIFIIIIIIIINVFFFSEKYVHLNDCRNEPMTSTSDTRPSGLWVSVPTVCKSVVQEELLLKTFAVEEEHVLTQARIMGQKGNLIALAGICEFHYSYFKRLWFNGSLNTGTSAHFKIDFLKCRRLHAQLPQTNNAEYCISDCWTLSWRNWMKVCGPPWKPTSAG